MIVVTGGAGFIGSAIVWGLNKAGCDDILVVDHLGLTEKWRNLRALRFSDYMEKDVFRSRLSSGAFGGFDAIIHMGACSSTTERDASYLADNNYNYSKELAEFCAARGVRFLYASSAATYGAGECGYDDNDEDKLPSLRPLNMYGYSKQLFDLWLHRAGLLRRFCGFKFTNVFGPNEYHKGDMRSVVCKSAEALSREGVIRLFRSHRAGVADGEQMRDFIYVKDAVAMVLHLLDKPVGGLFNVGSGRAESWNALAKAIFKAFGLPPRIEYIDMPDHLREKYQYYTRAEMAKMAAHGYAKAATPLEDAVAEYVQTYLRHGRHLGEEE